ncbi:hypothetical protein [Mycolicibacterium boenickei]|uniref:hypothetical protein n=1 Tax=Mycolicibacterium boenickei TaxID=146017 RepID=UPI001C65D5AD|nr:hypothetical protein [Mycolicibacterium boenickei]
MTASRALPIPSEALTFEAALSSADATVFNDFSTSLTDGRCVGFESFSAGMGAVDSAPASATASVAFEAAGSGNSGRAPIPGITADGRCGTFTGPSLMSREPILMLCAPPLLLIVTPGATWMLDDVFPEFFGPVFTPVAAGPPADVGSPSLALVDAPAAVGVPPVADPAVEAEDSELVDGESADVPSVSAAEIPYPVATAATNHAATAMPPYPLTFRAVWPAVRDGAREAGVLDASGAGTRLTG